MKSIKIQNKSITSHPLNLLPLSTRLYLLSLLSFFPFSQSFSLPSIPPSLLLLISCCSFSFPGFFSLSTQFLLGYTCCKFSFTISTRSTPEVRTPCYSEQDEEKMVKAAATARRGLEILGQNGTPLIWFPMWSFPPPKASPVLLSIINNNYMVPFPKSIQLYILRTLGYLGKGWVRIWDHILFYFRY